jgi:hypothetical protein
MVSIPIKTTLKNGSKIKKNTFVLAIAFASSKKTLDI